MKLYFAPMEGITGYIFRNTFNKYFGMGVDKYYTPFLTPCEKRAISAKEIKQVSPNNNKGINLVPQIITANVDDFNMVKERLRDIGYKEVNLNLGCPSRTVTSKGRGSGALVDIKKLDALLDGIFANGDTNISIKTRIGAVEPEEFEKIVEIYKKYPIYELTIHPRVMNQMYKGVPHMDTFLKYIDEFPFDVCYNGDICSASDYDKITSMCDKDNLSAVMIGRGALMNPMIFNEIKAQGDSYSKTEFNSKVYSMMKELQEEYSKEFSGQRPVLYKLKEIWSYLRVNYDDDKSIKKLLKTNSLEEFAIIEKNILYEG